MINNDCCLKTFASAINVVMRKIYIAVVLMMITAPVFAQLDSSKTLDEVVITGQYKPQSVKNSVYQVKVISKEKIQKTGATKLQDVLNNELNIRFAQDNATGGSGITMLGLKGQNVKILIDGLPMVGRQGTSNEIDINQVDINSIERIEIIEGPMSVVYGADALAGVINIITKKTNAAKISVTAKIHEETVGKEYGIQQGIHNQYAGLAWRNKKWEIGGGFGYNYFGGWKGDSTNRELTWHWKDQIIGNGFIGYNGTKLNIRYRFDGLDEIITNPGNFIRYQQDADDWFAPDQEYLSRRVMQQLQASYFVSSNLSFQAQSSYTNYNRSVSSTIVSQKTGRVSLDPAAGSQSSDDFNGFTFRGTAQYKLSSSIFLQPGIDINLESGKGERLKTGNNEVNDYAFFLTSEITPSAKINIRPGIRIIRNSVYDAPPVIPSINTKFVLSKKLDLRLAYARGFRSPSLRELYFNFFDANHQIVGNPDLEAETSNSFTGSLSWKTITLKQVAFAVTLNGFYNKVKNLIDYAVSSANSNLFVVTNVSNSKTAGGSLNGTAAYKNWNASAGFAYTGFYNDYAEADKSLPQLQWSPEINTGLGYTFPKIGLDVNLFYKFTGKKPFYVVNSSQQYVLSKRESYSWADFTVNKKLFRYFNINAGVRNLFDVKGINSTIAGGGVHGSNGITNIGYGRSYFAGLAFNWNKK
jgi:outer membrane receptor for ferrienterochelin and colicins